MGKALGNSGIPFLISMAILVYAVASVYDYGDSLLKRIESIDRSLNYAANKLDRIEDSLNGR